MSDNSSQDMKLSRLKVAAALAYDSEDDGAPRVVAAGRGRLAGLIEQQARDAGVPIYKNEGLAWTLSGLGLQREIPPELYQVVAHVIAWVGYLDHKAGKSETFKRGHI